MSKLAIASLIAIAFLLSLVHVSLSGPIEAQHGNATIKSRLIRSPDPALDRQGNVKFVPLKEFLEKAKNDKFRMDVVRKALAKFAHMNSNEIDQLLSSGKSTYKGNQVTLEDISKFCCPLGV
ncbi:hypothetical protein HDE_14042 [Halotydeus destructor]|nr:hypothetical protein HDE_14042 [Halotydeus destructor]